MALSTLVRRKEVVSSVIPLIDNVLSEERSRPPLSADSWLRVSSIGGLCPREEVLCAKYNIARDDKIDGASGLNLQFGNAIHWLFQNKAMGPTGKFLGSWRCTYCGSVYGSRKERLIPLPVECKCGAISGEHKRVLGRPTGNGMVHAFIYVEEWLGNEEYRIGGSPDGQMTFGDPVNYVNDDLVLLEFKSTNESNYRKYKTAPDFMHVVQVQMYMWLTGYTQAKIIYLNKNGRGTRGITEHDLPRDQEVVDRVLSAISLVRSEIATGVVPERNVCSNRYCQKAFHCPVRDLCFRI